MKKLFLLATLAALALTGCVKSDEEIVSEQEIAFSTVANKPTKAEVYGPIAGTTYPAGEHFGVYAYYTETDYATNSASAPLFMPNVEVEKDGTYWHNTTTKYYWPLTGKLTFAAYSPKAFGTGTVSSSCPAGVKFTGYTASTALASQVDLCVTDLIKDQTKQTAVATPFKHTLSQIVFTVAPKAMGYTVTSIVVNSITVKTVNTVGTWSSTDGSFANGSWGTLGTPASYEVLGGTAKTLTLSSTTAVAAGTPIIVIPQTCAGYAIDINYTVNYTTSIHSTVTVTKNIAASSTWEKGKKYTYNLQFSLDEILFNPEVSDWTNATAVSYDI